MSVMDAARSTSADKPVIRVLALDGGGIRGLSSLILLRDIMQRIAVKKSTSATLRPSDYFELIIGTGTGGISALFVGRMRMTVDEAIEAYLRLATEGFKTSGASVVQRWWKKETPLEGDSFTNVLGDIVQETLGDRHTLLQESYGSAEAGGRFCRAAVLATSSTNVSDPPYIFRSYPTSHPASPYAIHEVARATVATAGIFPPISLGIPPIRFIDAGVAGYNNPAEIALQESERIWPGVQIACLVSLGTGLQPIARVGETWQGIVEISRRLIEDCERAHYALDRRRIHERLPYFRFNVVRGLDKVDIKEWDEISGDMTAITAGYTRQPSIERSLNQAANVLVGKNLETSIDPVLEGLEGGNVFTTIHFHHESDTVYRPFSPLLNPPPEIFHGRTEFLELAINHLLPDIPARIAILGPGGIGKTSIALHLLHDRRIKSRFGEYRRFISCEGITSVSALVDTVCAAFDIRAVSDRHTALLSWLGINFQQKRLFIVLDNFETVWDAPDARRDAEDFLSTFATVPKLTLALTMRGAEHPSGIRWTHPRLPPVEPLPAAAARHAFLDNGAQEDGCLDALLQKVDYVPLAVTLMAKLGQNNSPSHLLQRWNDEQVRLLSRTRDKGRLDNMEVSIRISLQSHGMKSTPGALSLLSGISLLPSGVFDGDLTAMFPSIVDINLAAATLVEVSLAYYDTARTLKVLSPIRLHMLQYHRPLRGSRLLDDLEFFICEFVKQGSTEPGNVGYKDTVSVLSPATTNVETILVQALIEGRGKKNSRIIVASLNWTIFLSWTRPDTHIIDLATQLSRRSSRHPHLAECLLELGRIQYVHRMTHTVFKNLCEARKLSHETLGAALDLFHIKNRYTDIASDCLYMTGALYYDLGCYEEARKAISRSYKKMRSPSGRSKCLQYLGKMQFARGDHDGGRDLVTKAFEISETSGDRLGAARCLEELGHFLHDLKEYEVSKNLLTRALDEYEFLGSKSNASHCQITLGLVHECLFEYQQARSSFIKARETYEQSGLMHGVKICDEILERISSAEDASNSLTQTNL